MLHVPKEAMKGRKLFLQRARKNEQDDIALDGAEEKWEKVERKFSGHVSVYQIS